MASSYGQNAEADAVAEKAQALAPLVGKWKAESKLTGRTFYNDCAFEANQAILKCDVSQDSSMTEKTGQTITGFNPRTGLYYYHTYNRYGFMPLEMHINDDTWTIQGNTPSTEGTGFMRVVRTFIDENTSETVTHFSMSGREFEKVEELRVERIQ